MAAYGTPDKVDTYAIDGAPVLPETVTVGGAETAVTWNLDNVSFKGNPYSYVTVTGTTANGKTATAEVQLLPKDLEYMIDCNNTDSSTWEKVKAAVPGLKNADAADQEKTDDNTWGYTSVVGDSGDIKEFSQSSVSNPYTGGWWARSDKNITYQLTLPAGEHTIMLGSTGWWSMNREMDVYYSVNGENETKLCDFDAVKNAESYAQGTITLKKEAVVTITIKKAANDDPIVSWISVSGQETVVDKSGLQKLYDDNSKTEQGNYTDDSWKIFETALKAAEAVLSNEEATEEEVATATTALENAIKGLAEKKPDPVTVDKSELQKLYDANSGKEQGNYTDDSWKTFTTALEAAKAVLDSETATEEQVQAAKAALQAALDGLTVKTEDPTPTPAPTDPTPTPADPTPTPSASADKTNLSKLYEQYKDVKQGNYTDASYKAFTTALEAAKMVLETEASTQEEVSKAYSNLDDAIKGLETKTTQKPGSSQGTTKPGSSQNGTGAKTSTAAKTADNTPIGATAATMAAALLMVVLAWKKRKDSFER